MKVLEKFDFGSAHSGGRYDYAVMFDGQCREYVKGEDFECKPSNFRASVTQTAKRKGVAVRVAVTGDSVVVQAVKEVEADAAPAAPVEAAADGTAAQGGAANPAVGKRGKKK